MAPLLMVNAAHGTDQWQNLYFIEANFLTFLMAGRFTAIHDKVRADKVLPTVAPLAVVGYPVPCSHIVIFEIGMILPEAREKRTTI